MGVGIARRLHVVAPGCCGLRLRPSEGSTYLPRCPSAVLAALANVGASLFDILVTAAARKYALVKGSAPTNVCREASYRARTRSM